MTPIHRLLACAALLAAASPAAAQLTADFSATPVAGTNPLVVEFTDLTTGGPPLVWSWDFGDGGAGNGQHPVHLYDEPGTYTVELTVIAAGSQIDQVTKTDLITVAPATLAPDFVATSPTTGVVDLEVSFANITVGGPVTDWLWDFGDGTTSTAQQPTHVYEAVGTFDVSLTAWVGEQSETHVEPGFVTTTGYFAPAVDLLASSGEFATGDMDGDGDIDIVVEVSPGTDRLRLLRNTDGALSFGAPESLGSGGLTVDQLDVADVDGDGDLDVVAAGNDSGNQRVLWFENVAGDATTWTKHVADATAWIVQALDTGDIDGDGDVDVLLAWESLGIDGLDWLPNADGAGTFSAPESILSLFAPTDAQLADVDADGDLDVAFTDDGERFYCYTNDGSGAFSIQPSVDLSPDTATSVRMADADGDGDLDAFVAAGGLKWLEKLDPPFVPYGPPATVSFSGEGIVRVADIDRDGAPDVVTGFDGVGGDVLWYRNVGALGGFEPAPQHVLSAAHISHRRIHLVDLDRDGDVDVLASGNDGLTATNWTGFYENVFIPSAWTHLDGGSPGVAGVPRLTGQGTLGSGDEVLLALDDAPPSTLALAWLSFTSVPFDALGGTVHASPPTTQLLRATDGTGAWSQSLVWPAALPSGVDFWLQFIVQDGSVPAGLTLSNALTATTP